jgi:hypothetical protein
MAWKGALVMPKKSFSADQIVTFLRQIEVLMAQGKSAPVACRVPAFRSRAKRRMPQPGDIL